MKFIKKLFNPSVEMMVEKQLQDCKVQLLMAYSTMESWQAQVALLESKIKRLDSQNQAFAKAGSLKPGPEINVQMEFDGQKLDKPQLKKLKEVVQASNNKTVKAAVPGFARVSKAPQAEPVMQPGFGVVD